MRLGIINKLKNVLRKGLGLNDTSTVVEQLTMPVETINHTCVVLKEKKNSVQIICWNCSHQLWVQKGSRCHTIGLCSRCIGNFDDTTGTIKSR